MATHLDQTTDTSAATRVVEFDPATDPVVDVIVTAVGDLEGVPPTELDPLYHAVDPDALQASLDAAASGAGATDVKISVDYHGYTVTVYGYGVVEVAA